MNKETTFHEDIWRYLKSIKDSRLYLGHEDNHMVFEQSNDSHEAMTQELIFHILYVVGVIENYTQDPIDNTHRFRVNDPKFEYVYELYENKTGYINFKNKVYQIIDQRTTTKDKQVLFKPNGDLIVNEKRILNIELTTPDYYFLKILDQNFDQPVDHEKIYEYCVEQLADVNKLNNYEYQSSVQDFCAQRKSRIKGRIKEEDKKEIFEKIVISTRTSKGKPAYMMTNP